VRLPKGDWRWGWLAGALLAAGSVLALPATTEESPRDLLDLSAFEGGDKLSALVDGVVARQRSLHSLRADFIQEKDSALLLEPVRSTGEFAYLAPDRVRWDYRHPEAMVVLFSDDSVTTYHPRQRRAERVKVSRRDRRFVKVLAGRLPLDELTSHFRISLADPGAPEPYRLRLKPHQGTLRKKLESLVVEVDRKLLLPVTVQYNEADGDSTRYEFHSLELDLPFEDSRFLLEFGDGVTLRTIDVSSGIG
jgi:outer membrane lipoprotein carrier protein